MKKSLFFVLLFLLVQAHAQEIKLKGLIMRYNEAAAKDICFSVDVLDDKGNYLALCKDARATIVYVATQCQCALTATQKADIYFVAHEPIMPPTNPTINQIKLDLFLRHHDMFFPYLRQVLRYGYFKLTTHQ